MNKELKKIIDHYGEKHQTKKFNEETYEFMEAVIEYELHEDRYYADVEKELKNHIAEEMADVLVLLGQFKELYEIDNKTIKDIMKNKIQRQLKRIEEE